MVRREEKATGAETEFVSQATLEGWLDAGQATFEDDVLTIAARTVALRLVPAVRISTLLDGEDTAGLLGQTHSLESLQRDGAEHFRNSLIIGDTAYECEEGYIGTVAAPASVGIVQEPELPAAAPQTTAPGPEPAAVAAPAAVPALAPQHPTAALPPPSFAPPAAAPLQRASVAAPSAAAPPPPALVPAAAPSPPPAASQPEQADSEMLADYLLKHLMP